MQSLIIIGLNFHRLVEECAFIKAVLFRKHADECHVAVPKNIAETEWKLLYKVKHETALLKAVYNGDEFDNYNIQYSAYI